MDKYLVVGKCARGVNHIGLTGIRQVSVEEGSVFLGIPVGGAGFMKDHIYAVAERMRLLLSKLGQLDSSLDKFLILRASFGACRINHLLRALPFAVGRALSGDIGRLSRLVFVDCVGNGCDPSHFDLACLPSFSGVWVCVTRKGCTKLQFWPPFLHTLRAQKIYPNAFGRS